MPREAQLSPTELLRPEDLLENARYLLELGQQKAIRSVILESMTALEIYVHNKVFKILEIKYDLAFVKWLKDKTNFNFDDRLGYVTPYALDEDIEAFRGSELWRRYKEARELRNHVPHKGIIVSFEEAEKVYKTVYDWLAYLESSVGLELSLFEFKNTVIHDQISSVNGYLNLLNRFYLRSKAGFDLKAITQIKYPIEMAFEWGLKFGRITVSLDTKVSSDAREDFNYLIETIIGQTRIKLRNPTIDKAAVIVFYKGPIPESFEYVRNFEDGKIYIVAIGVEVGDK